MAKVMEKRFVNWQGQSFDEATLEPSEVAQAIMEYLDCECTYFPSMTDDDPIMSAYNYAKRESLKAVSYTHLDVYKRQVLNMPLIIPGFV